jgi:transposase-like protein
MAARWSKQTRPTSVTDFNARFPDDDACAQALAEHRWPNGFMCPHCGGEGWRLRSKRHTWQCKACDKQTSVTAGTVMHRSKIPLRKWFLAAHLVVTHSNGISAMQLWPAVGLNSYKDAWLLLQKIRRAMVNPDRDPLTGTVEVDETSLPFRRNTDPVAGGQGRSALGKMLLVGAVEIRDIERHGLPTTKPGRIRLSTIPNYNRPTLHRFIDGTIEPNSLVVSDGLPAYRELQDHGHRPIVVGSMAAHVVLPWIHRVFAQLKRWALGVYHGLRPKHLQAYLDEFVFRWNRRRLRKSSLDTLLDIVGVSQPASYKAITAGP